MLSIPEDPMSGISMTPVATLSGHTDRVWCVAWSPTANILASCSGDGTARLWSVRSDGVWQNVGLLAGEHDRTVRHVSWSPNGDYLACASFDHTVTIWCRVSEDCPTEFEVEGVLDGHESEVKCVSWASNSMLATCSRDHSVWVWERVEEGEYECAGVLSGHNQDVKCCLWRLPTCASLDAAPMVLSCSYDNTIKVWTDALRQDDWHCIQTLTAHEGTVWEIALQQLEPSLADVHEAEEQQRDLPLPMLATCSDDLSVIFWGEKHRGDPLTMLARYTGFAERSIYSIAWAPRGACVVACASGDDSITLLGLSQQAGADEGVHVCTLHRQLEAHESDVNTVSFSPFGRIDSVDGSGALLASGGDDGLVRIWRVNSGPRECGE